MTHHQLIKFAKLVQDYRDLQRRHHNAKLHSMKDKLAQDIKTYGMKIDMQLPDVLAILKAPQASLFASAPVHSGSAAEGETV